MAYERFSKKEWIFTIVAAALLFIIFDLNKMIKFIKISKSDKTATIICENKTSICKEITYVAYEDSFQCDYVKIPNNSCRIELNLK